MVWPMMIIDSYIPVSMLLQFYIIAITTNYHELCNIDNESHSQRPSLINHYRLHFN